MSIMRIGFALIADHRQKNLVNLNAVYYKSIEKYMGSLVSQIGPFDILFETEIGDKIRVRDDGSLFYYKNFKNNISSKDLNSMWRRLLKIKVQLGFDYIYENKIIIHIFSADPIITFEQNRIFVDSFASSILDNFSLHILNDEISALITITPIPETLNLNA